MSTTTKGEKPASRTTPSQTNNGKAPAGKGGDAASPHPRTQDGDKKGLNNRGNASGNIKKPTPAARTGASTVPSTKTNAQSSPFVRVSDGLKTTATWGGAGSPCSYADALRPNHSSQNESKVEKPQPTPKESRPPQKAVPKTEAQTSAPVIKPEVPPQVQQETPAAPPPQPAASYYSLEFDRVPLMKLPTSFKDCPNPNRFTFSSVEGAPPALQPQHRSVVLAPQQPPQALYSHEQTNFPITASQMPLGGVGHVSHYPGVHPEYMDRRFMNSGMPYNSHAQHFINRGTCIPPRDYQETRINPNPGNVW